MDFLKNLFYYRPSLDKACCLLLKQDRLSLPKLSLPRFFEERFTESTVRIRELPRGRYSTPINDLVILLKTMLCVRPSRILEVGSFRGYTALLMAQHLDANAEIVTVDKEENHGQAYRGTDHAQKIERRVGWTSESMFADDNEGTYDFIYLDATHTYEGVKHDTELLQPLLASDGLLVWHDYANWGYFSEKNRVPEYLHEFAEDRPVAHLSGSTLAAYSPSWSGDQANHFQDSLIGSQTRPSEVDPWSSAELRG